MNGKEKCQFLKSIRKEIAERYGLVYEPAACTYEGDCSGTCPRCEAELKDLQRQLTEKGIERIDWDENIRRQLDEFGSEDDSENQEESVLEGDPAPHLEGELPVVETPHRLHKNSITMGMPSYQPMSRRKKVLFKECAIAGWTFHDPEDWWNELDEGMELALVRDKKNKYDRHAVAVAFPCDFDGDADNFDFDFIIGYVPRADNEMIAKMMDMGWDDVFVAELSTLKQTGSSDSRLRMSIYIQSREEMDRGGHCYAQSVDEDFLRYITDGLREKGFVMFRWGGFPPWGRDLPEKGDEVFFVYKSVQEVTLYHMKVIATGEEAAFFTGGSPDELEVLDDCLTYVLTNIEGPLSCCLEQLDFLKGYSLSEGQPEGELPSDIADCFKSLFISEM